MAFGDTWTSESEMTYNMLMGTKIGTVISGMRDVVGTNDLMAYLVMMAIRLLELHRILKSTGSLYLHCDLIASHYLKVILDAVFEVKNFRNEVIWHYGQRTMHNKYKFNSKHDVILFYAKSGKHVINQITMHWTKEEISKTRARRILKDQDGREYILDNRSVSKGYPVQKQYIDDIIKKGKAIDSTYSGL